ncbi:unnamed protein product [Meganyctiphanes norvegica]|uniref:Uncharacterized protein n=1 Tax=Meganyctiphanes norvegica TaxID=48144 RepID=A0AAV2QLT5_MEGNR
MLFHITLVVGLICAVNAEAEASNGHRYSGPSAPLSHYGAPPAPQYGAPPSPQYRAPPTGPCPPQYAYVTQTQLQQVPVYTTQNVVVPTTILQTTTETQTIPITQQQFVTTTQFIIETVVETQRQVVTEIQEVTRTQVSTQVSTTAQYITSTLVTTQVSVRTEYQPHYVTQTFSRAHYVTVCPQPKNPYW